MKSILFPLISFILIGCSSQNREESSIDGVWKLHLNTEAYDSNSNEFIKTYIRENQFIFIAESDGVLTYHECDSNNKLTGELTENGIYIIDNELVKLTDNFYQNFIEKYDNTQNQYYTTLASLRKIRDSNVLDLGDLEIEGPISLSETTSVCSFNSNIRNSDWMNIAIRVPYFDRYLQLNLIFTDQLSIGTYNFIQDEPEAPLKAFYINSPSDDFYAITGTYELFPEQASFEFKTISDSNVAGTVVFNDFSGQPYTINFSANLLGLEP